MPDPSSTTLFCVDEDIAVRAGSLYSELADPSMKLAYGTDGVIAGGSPWTLASASAPAQLAALAPGNVVRLAQAGAGSARVRIGEDFGVASASGAGVVLRRKGMAAGLGAPPATAAGLDTVEFSCLTMQPEIARCSFDLYQRFGLDATIAGRTFADLYDPTEARMACVLMVLFNRAKQESRAPGDKGDAFIRLARDVKAELDDLMERISLHWKPPSIEPSTSPFGMRLSR